MACRARNIRTPEKGGQFQSIITAAIEFVKQMKIMAHERASSLSAARCQCLGILALVSTRLTCQIGKAQVSRHSQTDLTLEFVNIFSIWSTQHAGCATAFTCPSYAKAWYYALCRPEPQQQGTLRPQATDVGRQERGRVNYFFACSS